MILKLTICSYIFFVYKNSEYFFSTLKKEKIRSSSRKKNLEDVKNRKLRICLLNFRDREFRRLAGVKKLYFYNLIINNRIYFTFSTFFNYASSNKKTEGGNNR